MNKENLEYPNQTAAIDWIKTSPQRIVTAWINDVCRKSENTGQPFFREEIGGGIVSEIFRTSEDKKVINKIIRGVLYLLKHADWSSTNEENIEHHNELILSTVDIKTENIRNKLIELAENETLKKISLKSGNHLHSCLLGCLGFINSDTRVVSIYERDIQEVEYAALSYRMLWRHDRENATRYSDLMKTYAKRDEGFPTDLLFREANEKLHLHLA